MRYAYWFFTALIALFFISCSSHLLKYEEKDFESHGNYQKEIQVETLEVEEASPKSEAPTPSQSQVDSKKEKAKKTKASKTKKTVKKPKASKKKKPKIQLKERAFRPKESVTLEMTYFNMTAGRIKFEVLPLMKVNNELAYGFQMSAETLRLFEMVYKVKNVARSYVSASSGKPYSFELDVNESKKVRQARAIFDYKNEEVRYWEKLYTKDDGLKQKEEKWPLEKTMQSAYSAIFWMREYPFVLNKTYSMNVIHKKEKIRVDFTAIRKEEIENDLGKFKTIVVTPKIYKKGKLDEKTNVTMWLTDDDRKMIVRLEADIKLGTMTGKLVGYKP